MPDFSVDTQDLINGAVLGVLHIGGLLRLGSRSVSARRT